MVVVADGTRHGDDRLQRVLTADPGTGVMRHADAGYDEAIAVAQTRKLDLPMITRPAAPRRRRCRSRRRL